MNQSQTLRSSCPISCFLDTLGDKWSLLIIRDMVFANKKSFSDFLGSDESIARSILVSRLTQLEKKGIVVKQPHPSDGRKDTYTLTDAGLGLIPILLDMSSWGLDYDPRTTINPSLRHKSHTDRETLIATIKENIRQEQPAV